MLTLLLLRHAKSCWDDPTLNDFDRPLNRRGQTSAPLVGALIRAHARAPDLIVSSPSLRTRQTVSIMVESAGLDCQPMFDEALYLAPATALGTVMRNLPAAAQRVMIVAHNPGLHALALDLTARGNKEDIAAMARKFPTCGLAVLNFGVKTWEDVRPASGDLVWFVSPKRLEVLPQRMGNEE